MPDLPKSVRKFRAILKSDPNICVIKARSGPRTVLKAQFRDLLTLGIFDLICDRVAKIHDGWGFVASDVGFYAWRLERPSISVAIWTNAQTIEQHAIFDDRGPALNHDERQREGAKRYGMQIYFGRV